MALGLGGPKSSNMGIDRSSAMAKAKDDEGKQARKATQAGPKQGEKQAPKQASESSQRHPCPWECGYEGTSIQLQGHVNKVHHRGGTPGGASTLATLKGEVATLKEENEILKKSQEQRSLLSKEGLVKTPEPDDFDRQLSRLLKIEQLRALKEPQGGAGPSTDPRLLEELSSLRNRLERREGEALVRDLKDAFSGELTELRTLAEGGSHLSGREQVQVSMVQGTLDSIKQILGNMGPRIDAAIRLLETHLMPQQPGRIVEERVLSEEEMRKMEGILDEGLEGEGPKPATSKGKKAKRRFRVAEGT